jgi:hypothetical protein
MISGDHFIAIAALDLTPIKRKMMAQPCNAWSAAKADEVEAEYRKFLYRMKMCPDKQTIPTAEVDKFWRIHIIETRRYAEDCQRALGFFLHRAPFAGLPTKASAATSIQKSDLSDAGV